MLSVNAAVPFFLLDVPSYKYFMLSLNFCLGTWSGAIVVPRSFDCAT